MKRILLMILLVISIVCLSSCQADEGISVAFDLTQYETYKSTTTISKNGGVIIQEVVSLTKQDQSTYLETINKKTLAPIGSASQYKEITSTKEYSSTDYEPKLSVDLTRLTVPQLSQIIAVDGVRKLDLDLTAEEVKVLFNQE